MTLVVAHGQRGQLHRSALAGDRRELRRSEETSSSARSPLPSSTPYIITGVRIAAGRALVGVVVAEFIASNIGLGFYISENGSFLNSSRVMLGIALIGGFGVLIGELIRRLERRFEVWRPSIN